MGLPQISSIQWHLSLLLSQSTDGQPILGSFSLKVWVQFSLKFRVQFYFHDENPIKSEPHGGSDFGGYPSLKQRNDSFGIKESMTIHCGFIKGGQPGLQTGFDFEESDLAELQQFHEIIVSYVIFVNYDIIQQPSNMSELAIIAPIDSPNTDGIDPDSCTTTRIEDSFVVSGDDCIAVKSGWDQYGIKFNMPTKNLVIKRFTCISPDNATIALGSEMSGGIENVRAEDITAFNTQSGVRIKTATGRGGYVKDIYVKNMTISTMKYVFWMTGSYGSHPDPGFDPKAFPTIKGINYKNIVADNVTYSARLDGIENDPFTDICISNVTIKLTTIKPIFAFLMLQSNRGLRIRSLLKLNGKLILTGVISPMIMLDSSQLRIRYLKLIRGL